MTSNGCFSFQINRLGGLYTCSSDAAQSIMSVVTEFLKRTLFENKSDFWNDPKVIQSQIS